MRYYTKDERTLDAIARYQAHYRKREASTRRAMSKSADASKPTLSMQILHGLPYASALLALALAGLAAAL